MEKRYLEINQICEDLISLKTEKEFHRKQMKRSSSEIQMAERGSGSGEEVGKKAKL